MNRSDDQLVSMVDIARLLGVTKQRVTQITEDPSLGFPAPAERRGKRRLWRRSEVETWAVEWQAARPWRLRDYLRARSPFRNGQPHAGGRRT
jgi:predicted DNA-binding transcriptional regulator AlpA